MLLAFNVSGTGEFLKFWMERKVALIGVSESGKGSRSAELS